MFPLVSIAPLPHLSTQAALATVLSRLPECQLLLVGRWALDVVFAEMVAPVPAQGKDKEKGKDGEKDNDKSDAKDDGKDKNKKAPKFPSNIVFAEPPPTSWVPSDVIKREPRAIDLGRLIRMAPLIRGRGALARPTIDYNRVRL